jgi:hypothetical protein
MSKHFDRLLKTLKTRQDVTALGFSKDELKSLASDIDENLNAIEDTATDEDVENAIKTAIDGVIPMLKLAQMQASRIVAKKLKEQDDERKAAEEEAARKKEEEEKKAEEEGKKTPEKKPDDNPNPKPEEKKEDDELKSLIKALTDKISKQDETIASQNARIESILSGSVKEKRKAVLEAKLKGAGTIGKTYRRMFERIDIKDDEEFDNLLEQLDEDLKDYKQDVNNELLARQTAPPPAPDKSVENEEVEVMSDDEIKAMAQRRS